MLQFIPARGRKQVHAPHAFHQLGCNLSPRGDGNKPRFDRKIVQRQVAIYPREGTETRSHRSARKAGWLQFIPARGRKHLHFSHSFTSKGCNLSPRGDGNIAALVVPFNPARLQFIPARGRKPFPGVTTTPPSWKGCNLSPRGDGNTSTGYVKRECKKRVAIYPREGTETAM